MYVLADANDSFVDFPTLKQNVQGCKEPEALTGNHTDENGWKQWRQEGLLTVFHPSPCEGRGGGVMCPPGGLGGV